MGGWVLGAHVCMFLFVCVKLRSVEHRSDYGLYMQQASIACAMAILHMRPGYRLSSTAVNHAAGLVQLQTTQSSRSQSPTRSL